MNKTSFQQNVGTNNDVKTLHCLTQGNIKVKDNIRK